MQILSDDYGETVEVHLYCSQGVEESLLLDSLDHPKLIPFLEVDHMQERAKEN